MEEQDSYEPPVSSGNEDGSVLSFESDDERGDMQAMAAQWNGDYHNDHAMNEEYTDFDGLDPSGYSVSEDESERLPHQANHMQLHHHHQGLNGSIAGLPVHE